MRRRVMGIVAGVSAVLLVGLVLVWVRSYSKGDKVGFRRVGMSASSPAGTSSKRAWMTETVVATYSGTVSLTRQGVEGAGGGEQAGWFTGGRFARPGYSMDGGFAGFEYRRVTGPGRWLYEVRVPMWALAFALAAGPVVWVLAWWRRVDRRGGFEVVKAGSEHRDGSRRPL